MKKIDVTSGRQMILGGFFEFSVPVRPVEVKNLLRDNGIEVSKEFHSHLDSFKKGGRIEKFEDGTWALTEAGRDEQAKARGILVAL